MKVWWPTEADRELVSGTADRTWQSNKTSAVLVLALLLASVARENGRVMRRLAEQSIELALSAGGSRLGVFLVGRVVSPLQRRLYRVSGGRVSLTGRAPVLLLTTTGRKTGQDRTVPVFYLRDGQRIVVCFVTPHLERINPWTLNLKAITLASVQFGKERIDCRARAATDEEIARYWPRLIRIWPAFKRFFDQGGARSIFVLDRVEAA